jgi:hypothetical protein
VAAALREATKDELILAMLAVLGGETREVNERDLFLASWHAFPNTMRWVDTALPNPDTFTASLRRLDQKGAIVRVGKQQRQPRRRRRKTALDPGRGVVKARVAEGGLERLGVSAELVEEVRRLRPDPERSQGLDDGALIVLCVGLREAEGRQLDEGALAELAFHKFPDRFSYEERPEFPDLERIRTAISLAREHGLIDDRLGLTDRGRELVTDYEDQVDIRLDASEGYKSGDLKFADRIEESPAYQAYADKGTLVATKPDELYRALRIPPTTDPQPVADALVARAKALRRIDKGEIVDYLMAIARRYNSDVAALVEEQDEANEETAAAVES